MRSAQENIHAYKKSSCSQLHEYKTIIIKLGKARTNNITKTSLKVNFTIMKDIKNETYLEEVIGNSVIETQTFDKAL